MRYCPERALAALHAGEGPFVVAQVGQTLDGRIATITGASRNISGRAALAHLHRLRAAVDAVLVGVGTVAADDPQLTVRLVAGRDPVRVVVDPSGRMPAGARMLSDGRGAPVVATLPGVAVPAGAVALPVVPDAAGQLPPASIVAALAASGLRRILVEGGSNTIGRFLDAGRIDALHVLVAPMIIGSGTPGFVLRPVRQLRDALRPRTEVHVFDDGDVLFTCDMRTRLAAAE